ncbi:MAG: hypothetical protein KAS49_04495 [Candidatus Cloacimonetes bacterium]|nr:hypothetical protein [Candidatus Cloacimonadota bacterium]
MRVKKRKNQNLVVCPKNKQFTDLVVCAASCDRKMSCKEYVSKISIEMLTQYIEEHPEYEIRGELMATKKTQTQTTFWVIDKEKKVIEVTEEEIMQNPLDYRDMEIWDKPPYKYEVVVTLKRKKV